MSKSASSSHHASLTAKSRRGKLCCLSLLCGLTDVPPHRRKSQAEVKGAIKKQKKKKRLCTRPERNSLSTKKKKISKFKKITKPLSSGLCSLLKTFLANSAAPLYVLCDASDAFLDLHLKWGVGGEYGEGG